MTHLALGDYVYQRTFLHALVNRNRGLKLDVWFDDCRQEKKPWHEARSHTLSQWLESEPFIDKVFPIAKDAGHHQQLIERAKERQYDIIVFIATQRTEKYADVARQIGEHAYIVGSKSKPFSNFIRKQINFSNVDAWFHIDKMRSKASKEHINQQYRQCFETCFGPLFRNSRPVLPLTLFAPDEYIDEAKAQVSELAKQHEIEKPITLFVNHLSTTEKRNWPFEHVIELFEQLRAKYQNLMLIINTPPAEHRPIAEQVKANSSLNKSPILVVTAHKHFNQLPAMIEVCDLTLSVETAVMHLASSLEKPLIALMRKKAENWKPLVAETILYAKQNVNDIGLDEVTNATSEVIRKIANGRN